MKNRSRKILLPLFLIALFIVGCAEESGDEIVLDVEGAADFWGAGGVDPNLFHKRECDVPVRNPYYYASAQSVAAVSEQDLMAMTPPADNCPILECDDYIETGSCLGGTGPLSAYGPLGYFSPVGDDWWNVSELMEVNEEYVEMALEVFQMFLKVMHEFMPDWWEAWLEFMGLDIFKGCLDADEDGYHDGECELFWMNNADVLSVAGPLGPTGPLGNAYYGLPFLPYPDNGFGPHLEAGGIWAPLGPTGPLGPLGAVGPLGPVGALAQRGITRDSDGNWRHDGNIVRDIDVDWAETSREEIFEAQYLFFSEISTNFMDLESNDEEYLRAYFETEFAHIEGRMDFGVAAESRTYDLFEMYQEEYAAQMMDNDTSCMILGNGNRSSIDNPDIFTFNSVEEQFVTIVAAPKVQLSDFDILVTDVDGNELARSMNRDPRGYFNPFLWTWVYPPGYVEWVQIRLPANTTFQVRIWLDNSQQYAVPDDYKLYVTGSTAYLAESDVCGSHQVTYPIYE